MNLPRKYDILSPKVCRFVDLIFRNPIKSMFKTLPVPPARLFHSTNQFSHLSQHEKRNLAPYHDGNKLCTMYSRQAFSPRQLHTQIAGFTRLCLCYESLLPKIVSRDHISQKGTIYVLETFKRMFGSKSSNCTCCHGPSLQTYDGQSKRSGDSASIAVDKV